MIEALIAVVITAFGILAVMSMQPLSWHTAKRADLVGRAAGILHRELQDAEITIMNPNNPIPANIPAPGVDRYASGPADQGFGDATYTVQKTVTNNGGSWTVRVDVTDPDGKTISESIIVTRQEGFRY
jgi:Tfp pilus assembly protein PilV